MRSGSRSRFSRPGTPPDWRGTASALMVDIAVGAVANRVDSG
jgi:hypothetical protein